MVEINFIEVYC